MADKSAEIGWSNLRTFPLIGELSPEDIAVISPYLKINEYPDRAILLKQGQSSGSFHILLNGLLDVYLENETKVSVAQLKPGDFVGEMSCLTGRNVSATVQAVGPVTTVSMPRDGMLLLMERSPSFRRHMIEAMVERIRESNDRVNDIVTKSISVIRQLELERQHEYGPLIGSSPFMRQLRKQIEEQANRQEPLCMIGEKGTGKFHAAYEIHRRSRRAGQPIMSVDGGNFRLEEWEMKLRAAREGTMILEHAELLPADLLNQLLESSGDTRVILTARVKPPLNVHSLCMIPLRERTEDIPALAFAFLQESGATNAQEALSREAIHMLGVYPYLEGNIQEFAAVATDVVSGEAYIFNKGRVSHAICASTAIPGIIKPYKLGSRRFVDGAVVSPVPVALAKSMGADIVIAVDLSTPQRTEPKNFVASILQTIDMMSKKIVTDELQLADFVLRPVISPDKLSFKHSAYNIAMGEKAASEVLDAIQRKLIV